LVLSAAVLIALTLVQVTVGTQVREHVDEALDRGSARAEALASVGSYDRWHRDLALVVVAGTAWMAWLALTRYRQDAPLVRAAWATVALVAAQVLLGATMAYFRLTPPAQVAHLTVASLLLGAETVLLLLARWLPVGN
jgi:heme a synthase